MQIQQTQRRQRQRQRNSVSRIIFGCFACLASFGIGAFVANPSVFSALRVSLRQSSGLPHPVSAPAPSTPAPTPPPSGVLPPDSIDLVNPNAPLVIETKRVHDIPMTLIVGGTPGSRRSPVRQGVAAFVQQAGAVAGLNGTFFANASVSGTDNLLIGPSICGNETLPTFSPFDKRPMLQGRPFVLISPKHTSIVPYDLDTMDDQTVMKSMMPDLTDAFLGGVWLVHNGVAADEKRMDSFNVTDCNDPRRRAFFAIMPDGRPVLGATTYVATSKQLARALEAVGVQEAVLLDSGFSTSLVFQDKILVTGHTSPGIPSRPVPHALVLFGTPAADTSAQNAQMDPAAKAAARAAANS